MKRLCLLSFVLTVYGSLYNAGTSHRASAGKSRQRTSDTRSAWGAINAEGMDSISLIQPGNSNTRSRAGNSNTHRHGARRHTVLGLRSGFEPPDLDKPVLALTRDA